MYEPRPQDLERIANDFRYHRPFAGHQAERYEVVRALMHHTARRLLELCPPSRELSLALTKLEEAMFWGNAAIARNERPPAE